MPQPDNQRTRGSNAPRLEGTKIAPEGTSGAFNSYGVAQNVAATQRTSGLQIGQQARIINDGSSLYTALQGLAEGISKGVEQYDRWETKIAEKRQNDWETELIEYGRTVNNNPKKMAEWARLSEYRPNAKTAKRYNSLRADMEGKEYDAYQDDLIFEVSAAASTMDMSTAARYYADEMSKLDPSDKAFAAFARASNELNKQMTSLSTKFDMGQTGQGYDVGIFDLGAQLRAGGVTAADLDNERAAVVGAAYNYWGSDPTRLTIAKNGDITYKASDGTVHTGSFRGGLNDALIQTMRADLGADPGDMAAGTFNPRIAENVQLAIAHGAFNKQHTARGSAGGSAEIRLDVMRAAFSNPAFDISQLRAVFVNSIALPAGATDAQRKAQTKKVMGEFVESIIASDMSPDEKIEALNNFILVANPENNSTQYELNGYAGDLGSGDISGALDKARAEVRQININASKEEAQRVDNASHNSLNAQELRGVRTNGVFNALRRFSTVGDSGQPPRVVLGDGTVLTGVKELQAHFTANQDASVDASVHIIDNRLTTPEVFGNGIWIGAADAPAPTAIREWQVAQRRNYEAVVNVNSVVGALEQGREVAVPNAVAAFDTVMSKLGPNPKVKDVAPALNIMLGGAARQNWGKETKEAMTAKLIDKSSTGSGAKLQQLFSITAEQAFEFMQFTPEGLAAAAANPETADDVLRFQLAQELLSDPSTRELGGHLMGDANGTAAWYLTTGHALYSSYQEFHNGEAPTAEWMRLARNFEYMPAVMDLASETVDLLWQMSSTESGDVGQLMVDLGKSEASDDPSVIVARQLRDMWDSSQGEGEPTFMEILTTPDHEDRLAFENWIQRSASAMAGSAALVAMLESEGYAQLANKRDAAAQNGTVINSPEMERQQIANMWLAGSRAVGPPTGGFMTADNADAATVNQDGIPVDTRTQAVIGGIRYLQEALTTRRAEGMTPSESDLTYVLGALGMTDRMTDDPTINQMILTRLAEGDPISARELFIENSTDQNDRVRGAGDRRWLNFMTSLEAVFVPKIDYRANATARNLTDANFKVKIVPQGDVPGYIQDLVDRPFDNPSNPDLKFTRVAPKVQQGPMPETTDTVDSYNRADVIRRANAGNVYADITRMDKQNLHAYIASQEDKMEQANRSNVEIPDSARKHLDKAKQQYQRINNGEPWPN